MVKFALRLKAELEGVTDLKPIDEPESPFEYTFIIECTNCREEHAKPVNINRFESHDITGSRGEASFVFRCKMCKSEHSSSIVRTDDSYTPESDGKFVDILLIDARGMEFKKFIPEGLFQCKGADSKAKFMEVDLSEGEWYDYDDDAGAEVSVTNVEWSLDRY